MNNKQIKQLDMKSKDIVSLNIENIGKLFPNCVVESKNGKRIDFDLLRQELSYEIIQGNTEKYQLNWPGKKEAMVVSNTPTTKTLRPLREKSINFDTTQNIYIEGDNIEALKILQESYLNKIKCIYIDPPYNRGSDLIYKDDYGHTVDDELKNSDQIDENNRKLVSNLESNGRYHSDWLTMMYERLRIAKNLLRDDGCIFISIDDNEQANLKKMCDEIFGENNFVNCIAVKMSEASGVKMAHKNERFPKIKEYILFYKKAKFKGFEAIDTYMIKEWDKENNIFLENFTIEDREKLKLIEEKEYKSKEDINQAKKILSKAKRKSLKEKLNEIGIKNKDKAQDWCFEHAYAIIKTAGSTSLLNLVKEQGIDEGQEISASVSKENILFYYVTDFNYNTKQPRLQVIFADENIYKNPCDFWQDIKTTGGIAQEGGVQYNNGKKPLKLLNRIIKMTTADDDIVMDFFAGSASTAHSVMELNSKDLKRRKYIMVQIDEDLDRSYKIATGPENKKTIKDTIEFLDSCNRKHYLSELGEERIIRSGKKIKEETKADIDYGFRVFKIDTSNMKDIYYEPEKINQAQLDLFETNIKEDRSGEDLLIQVMLDLGLTLDLKIEKKKILNNNVYFVNENSLVACFDDKINKNLIEKICEIKPSKIVFKEKSFEKDSDKVNLYEKVKKLLKEKPEDVLNII